MSPPLIQPSRLQRCLTNFRLLWADLSRTRSLAPPNSHPRHPQSPPGIWGHCGQGVGSLVYRGLGITSPLLFACIVGIVTTGIAGSNITSSLLVAAITSLLTGFCYAELVTWNTHSSGQAYTMTYQLVGEFPAFIVGSLNLLCCATSTAVVSKTLSGTMDVMSRGKISAFVISSIGKLPVTDEVPDVVGGGAALVAAVLLAFGLQQAGVLRLLMNLVSLVGVMVFVGIGASHIDRRESTREDSSDTDQLVSGAAVCCILFSSFYELGRLSKAERRPQRVLPLAMSINSGVVFLAAFPLGIVLSLMHPFSPPASLAPLMNALQLRDVSWARLFIGSCQILVMCLALVECGESLSLQLVRLGSDGLLPSALARENHRSFSHVTAHLIGGALSSILAFFINQVPLLELLCTCILMMNVLVVSIVLYRRHRCAYATICSIAASPASKSCARVTMTSYHKLNTNSKQRHTFNILKDGLSVLPKKVSGAMKHNNDASTDGANQPLLEELGISIEDDEHILLQHGSMSLADSDDESEESAGYGSDTSTPEEDVDKLVAQYREQYKVDTVDLSSQPTPESARKAAILVVFFTSFVGLTSTVINHSWKWDFSVLIVVLPILIISCIITLFCIARMPVVRPFRGSSFSVVAFPWLPAATLFLNMLLLTEVFSVTWPLILTYFIVGCLWYFLYSRKHSLLSVRPSLIQRPTTETICLSPMSTIYTSSAFQQSSSRNTNPASQASIYKPDQSVSSNADQSGTSIIDQSGPSLTDQPASSLNYQTDNIIQLDGEEKIVNSNIENHNELNFPPLQATPVCSQVDSLLINT